MKRTNYGFRLMHIVGSLLSLSIALFAQTPGPDDIHWDDRFGIPGTSYYQTDIAVDPRNGDVYAGGSAGFTMAGNVFALNIAKWTRSTGRWSALSTGIKGTANALAVNPLTGELTVAGNMSQAGSATTNNYARWNGTAWSGVPTGGTVNPTIPATLLTFNPANGTLYAAGNFRVGTAIGISDIGVWNGSIWTQLGAAFDNTVTALTYAPSSNTLYVGGTFTSVAGKTIIGLARWTGTAWDSVGGNLHYNSQQGTITAIAVDGANVYVAGVFTRIGSVPVSFMAVWNGSTWSQFGTGLTGAPKSIAVVNGKVYIVSNNFLLAVWDGNAWKQIGARVGAVWTTSNAIDKIYPYQNELIAVGSQTYSFGHVSAHCFARFDLTTLQWTPLSNNATMKGFGGLNASNRVSIGPDGAPYVIGDYKTASTVFAGGVAKWNGTSFEQAIGYGFSGAVNAIAWAPNGDTYVGGVFSDAFDTAYAPTFAVNYNRIAKYEKSTGLLKPLGTGVNGTVYDLAMVGSTLYAGGEFKTMDGKATSYIGRWNGSAWDTLGSGVKGGFVYCFAVAPNGDLYAGGDFTSAGGVAKTAGIAKWNGTKWDSVGSGLFAGIRRIIVKNNIVYAGGTFNVILYGKPVSGFVKYDGVKWDTVSTSIVSVKDFAFQGDTLFVSGYMKMPGAVNPAFTLAMIVNGVLKPVGSGTGEWLWSSAAASATNPSSIAVAGNDVYFAGGFSIAGNRPSLNFAHWNGFSSIVSDVRFVGSTSVPGTFALEQNYPNPFNPSTKIRFSVPVHAAITITVYNILGQQVATLVQGEFASGTHEVEWRADVASGIYFYRMEATRADHSGEKHTEVRKMLLLR